MTEKFFSKAEAIPAKRSASKAYPLKEYRTKEEKDADTTNSLSEKGSSTETGTDIWDRTNKEISILAKSNDLAIILLYLHIYIQKEKIQSI